jgi:hypothetical protein
MATTPIGTVKVITVSFLEDEVWEGSLPRECYENASVAEFECDDVEEAVRVIQREGLTFAATGNDWAANPDGSTIVNYATAERHEVTAHIDSFSDADAAAIIESVG